MMFESQAGHECVCRAKLCGGGGARDVGQKQLDKHIFICSSALSLSHWESKPNRLALTSLRADN